MQGIVHKTIFGGGFLKLAGKFEHLAVLRTLVTQVSEDIANKFSVKVY
jgi:hypothetical protein